VGRGRSVIAWQLGPSPIYCRVIAGMNFSADDMKSVAWPLKEIVMETKEIEQKVIDIVAEQMGVDKGEINRDTHFINDLNADSLDTVELVMEFEDEFETSIPDEEAEKIQTVGQAIDYILAHIEKTAAGGE
jgi:acyl carrier protein